MNAAATEIIHQRIGAYTVPRITPATTTPWTTTAGGACVHTYQRTSPCHVTRPDDQNTIIFADASGTIGLTPAAGGAALKLRPDETGQLRQHHQTGTTIFGASFHGELKTLVIIVDGVNAVSKAPRDQPHHLWVVSDAAVDFQIVQPLARHPLHKATDSSLGTHALHLWVALRNLPGRIVLHLIKQEFHRYNLGNGHIDLHAHNQLAEHVPTPDEPPLHHHMQTHLQHLPQIPHPWVPPPWVPDDLIYNDTGRAYHYPQPLRTMAHIQGSHADNTLMTRLQQELQTTLYYSAVDPSLLPVHLQKRRVQLLLEQLPLLNRAARWYSGKGVDIPPEYTMCPCYVHTPERWDIFTKCQLAQDGVHLAMSRPEDTITQYAGWGRAPLPANKV